MNIHSCSIEAGGYLNSGQIMRWCWFSGAPTPCVPGTEHYQKRVGASRCPNYYQEHEVVYNVKLDCHRPFALQEQGSLETQRSLSRILLIENRHFPILYKPLEAQDAFCLRYARED